MNQTALSMFGNGRGLVTSNLEKSLDDISFWDMVLTIYKLLAIAGPVILIYAYIRYGRNLKSIMMESMKGNCLQMTLQR